VAANRGAGIHGAGVETQARLGGISDDIKWELGQPDNLGGRQDCGHLKNIKGSGLFLTDRNCTDKYILACKVRTEMEHILFQFNSIHLFSPQTSQNKVST